MKKLIRIIIALIMISGIAFVGYKLLFKNNEPKKPAEVKIENTINKYGYTLEETETKLFKDNFLELKTHLESSAIDENTYASLISKLFIIDFFTLDNKIVKNDVGGVQFIHETEKADFILKAQNTMYKYVENNIYGDRKQELPIVKTVEIVSVNSIKFTYAKTTDNKAFEIKLKWTYEKDLGYQTEATVKLVHENDKISIVEMK